MIFTLPFKDRAALYPEITHWHPASGHPAGWRVVRETEDGIEELDSKSGNRIIFRSYESAKRRCDKLNGARP